MVAHEAAARSRALMWVVLFELTGCAVGPDFSAPSAPAVNAYRKAELPQATAAANAPSGDAQRSLQGADVPARWWTMFLSDALNRRVEQALAHSPSLASAQAALRQAQENASAARSAFFPAVDAKAAAERGNANGFGFGFGFGTEGAGSSPGAAPSTFTLYNVSGSYTLDLFGSVRRSVEAQSALADFQRSQLERPRSLDLVRDQYKDGAANYLRALDASCQHQQAHIDLIHARAARLTDMAALYPALDGSWQAGVRREVIAIPITQSP
jgi:outer membrane protein TolC